MKFGMFMLTDLTETVVVSALAASLFLGGWQVPYLTQAGFHFPGGSFVPLVHGWVVWLQIFSFTIKVAFLCWFLMLIRWTLPRFRYDQAMRLGWLFLFPLSLVNILATAAVIIHNSL
jgi:NADH-quinone oxidoreductase subunit H